ncbi:hypothetical protein RD110_08100 [Rhodoferax koreense]|uniref:Uncharacterized protein n=1 Tax=Rhodoferax koreensis TaxID=1842727 RepID=A0A1P8JTV7_9BURK|nr:hypothetical protein [Rhodoferax koreense]APW37165.1 hypothetical protein RD110_08100 [Rhodoferax koreense]
MNITQITAEALTGGQSTSIVNAAGTSAQSPVVVRPANHPAGVPVKVLVTPDNTCFGRKGTNPTALNDGTDQVFVANTPYRIELMEGERMAFISTAGGTVKWTPGA